MKTNLKLVALLAAVICFAACEPTDKGRTRDITYTVNPGTQASPPPAARPAAHPHTRPFRYPCDVFPYCHDYSISFTLSVLG